MSKFLTPKMRCSNAQSSIELFTLVGVAFLVVILFVVISANETREFTDQKKFFLIKDLALSLQKEVTIANSVEDGYERSFILPIQLENTLDYDVITQNRTITINSSKTVYAVAIPDITGNFSKGTNKIEKKDSKIFVNR